MKNENPKFDFKTVVLFGEGNFSYALARARYFLHLKSTLKLSSTDGLDLIATSFDSHEELVKKYPETVQIL